MSIGQPDGARMDDALHQVIPVGHIRPAVSGFELEDELVVVEGISEGSAVSSGSGGPACDCHRFARTFRFAAEVAKCLACGLEFPIRKHVLIGDRVTWARPVDEANVAQELESAAAEWAAEVEREREDEEEARDDGRDEDAPPW